MSQQEATVPQFQLHHRLELAMETAGVTVAEMAGVIGYSVKQTSNYLHGRQTPREGTVAAWALRCGVPVEWLRYGIDPVTSPDPDGTTSDLEITESGCIAESAGQATIHELRRPITRAA